MGSFEPKVQSGVAPRSEKGREVNKEVARLGGFEPPTSGSGDQCRKAILMILLAQSCTLDHGFIRYSALNGPKSDPSFGMNPYSETSSLGTLAAFI